MVIVLYKWRIWYLYVVQVPVWTVLYTGVGTKSSNTWPVSIKVRRCGTLSCILWLQTRVVCTFVCSKDTIFMYPPYLQLLSDRWSEGPTKEKKKKKANLDLCRNLTQDLREINVLMWELVYGEAQILLNILLGQAAPISKVWPLDSDVGPIIVLSPMKSTTIP